MSANNTEAQNEGSKDLVDLQEQSEKADMVVIVEEPCTETKGNKITTKIIKTECLNS